MTTATVDGNLVARATGGSGGTVSPSGSAGGAGSYTVGTQLSTPTAGGSAPSGSYSGGVGAKGYTITTTVGTELGSLLSYGSNGTTYPQGSSSSNTPGTGYGAGGSGGSALQSDQYNTAPLSSNAGLAGAVFIWWGY